MITGIPDNNRGIERLAGLTGLFISVFIVSAIFTSLDVVPDYINIHEDLSYLGENLRRFMINTWIWFINAILVILFGPLILMIFLPRQRPGAYLSAFLISSTGILCLIYSIAGYNLISLVKDYLKTTGEETEIMAGLSYYIMVTRGNLHLAIYTLAGLSAVVFGLLIAKAGFIPKFIGWMASIGGLMYAGLGWISTDNLLFMIGRLLFILSLILLGSTLLIKGLKIPEPEKT